ncbi:MAG: hypothetical protein DWQ37_14920 [Planctomycetota bacterium]|nr:MAG: hypothetical protein DWQ37_14920 [Planctomycetota bacterium]
MFRFGKRATKRGGRSRRYQPKRRFGCESLELRAMLSGVVNVDVVGGNLYIYGDGSNNQVEIYQNPAVGSFHISSPDDTLFTFNGVNPPTFQQLDVNGVINDIEVYLEDGNDTFRFLGRQAGGQSSVQQNLYIENWDGSNVNEIIDTLVNGYFEVYKDPTSSGYAELLIRDSKIIGYTDIDNFGNGEGDTKTTIDNSILEDYLEIYNPYGSNTVDVLSNSQFGTGQFIDPAQPIIYIDNDGGASRISFAGSSQVAGPGTTTVYGAIEIFNGFNPEGTLNYLTLQSVNVLGYIEVVNYDGDTKTMVLDTTTGSSSVVPPGGSFVIENEDGYDTFEMKDSDIPWGLYIDNDFGGEGQRNYGSATSIVDSSLGGLLNPLSDYAFELYGDDGADSVTISGSTLAAGVYLDLYDGQNSATLQNSSMSGFEYYGGNGDDIVTIDNTTILYYVYIYLYEGADELHMMNMDYATQWPSILLDIVEIDGGLGVDTLTGAKPPANVYQNFEFELP